MVDLYPSFLRKGYRREIFIAILCSISYLLGLTMVTEVGGCHSGCCEVFPSGFGFLKATEEAEAGREA